MYTKKPRKQRKRQYNAPLHIKRKWMGAHLAENLLLKYDHRGVPIIKGDTVKVMRGSFRGHEDKVASVDIRKQIVEVEGVTTVKADGTKIAKPIHASNLLITKLNLTDKWRRKKLERGLSEETKKEIEKEAEEQMKEIEEEKKVAEPKVTKETDAEKISKDSKQPVEKEIIKKKEEVKKQPQKVDKKTKEEKKIVEKKTGGAEKPSSKKTAPKSVKKPKGDKK
jgi:large subunit ribosomal protein L24